ncbi:hypothetical protein ACFY04_25895 [Streptomyces sp. NPDC001549]|uniref:hypothetical protein n=1 Tax=Streptomyces sp. NPDC001549 TaxID=3364586 RepID=UPI0036A298A4
MLNEDGTCTLSVDLTPEEFRFLARSMAEREDRLRKERGETDAEAVALGALRFRLYGVWRGDDPA